jgi:membrane-associated phospholipid phosphatase
MSRHWPARAGRELVVLDRAVYDAVHTTPSPALDHAVARLSRAADHSVLWLVVSAGMCLFPGGPRRNALVGVAAVAVTSAAVNLAVKPVVRRERPLRHETVRTHVVRMPLSASYPSGHAASAFAFSTAVGAGVPRMDSALRLMAVAVAYSRVHTGVHYPGDVVAGAVVGAGIGTVVRHLAHLAGLVEGPGGHSSPPRDDPHDVTAGME